MPIKPPAPARFSTRTVCPKAAERCGDKTGPGLWTLPLWWTIGDVIMPFAVRWRYVPHELHVKLYKPGEGPVTEAAPVAR